MVDKKIIIYKGSMITSFAIIIISFLGLGLNPYFYESLLRDICEISLAFGMGMFFITEVIFNLIPKASIENINDYLKADVVFAGLGMCLISFMFLIYNTIVYAVYLTEFKPVICVSGVALSIAYMMLQKRRLRATGVSITNKISIISLVIVALVVLGFVVSYYCFEFIVFSLPLKSIPIISETRSYAQIYSVDIARDHSMIYVFIISTTPLFVSVLLNYIELMIKVKK